jgi:hypothetical protein
LHRSITHPTHLNLPASGNRHRGHYHGGIDARSAKVRASTSTPAAICDGLENSSARCDTPPRQGIKIIATGEILAMNNES